jgi:hypothetical protein
MQEWEARQIARDRWGPDAWVEQTDAGFYVGDCTGKWWFKRKRYRGWGLSWEAAFEDTEKGGKK